MIIVLSLALHDTHHTPVAQCSLFVLKMPLNTKQTNLHWYWKPN